MRGLRPAMIGTIVATACLVSVALPVDAEVYGADLHVPGDLRVVRDSQSGLDWLRLDETAGVDMSSILSGHGGWVDSGWRYATQSETCEMLSHVFEIETPPDCSFPGDGVDSFFDLFGILAIDQYTSGVSYASWAYFVDDDPLDPLEGQLDAVSYWEYSTPVLEGVVIRENALSRTNPFIGTSVGSLLVRATPSPIPVLGPIGQLLLAGCVVLAGAATSRRTRPRSSARPGRSAARRSGKDRIRASRA